MSIIKTLIDLPVVISLAEWIWGNDDDDINDNGIDKYDDMGHENEDDTIQMMSPQICLHQIPYLSTPCLSQLIAKLSGIGIIIGACFNKTPTILLLIQAQTADGFSRSSIYSETLFYMNASIYGILEHHPFTAYGENLTLLVQCIVFIGLIWKYSSKKSGSTSGGISWLEQLSVILGGIVYTWICIYQLPMQYRYLLHASNDIIIIYAGGIQIYETYKVKHTGAQSIITTSMNLVGEILRIFTTLQETGDIAVLSGFILCVACSLIMFLQYFYYQHNTQQFWKNIEQEKKKKKKQA